MQLENFKPYSQLVTKKTLIDKPKFDVIDCHAHFGAMALGKDYEQKYDINIQIDLLKTNGIVSVINPDIAFGDELKKMQFKIADNTNFINTFAGLDLSACDDSKFENYVYKTLEQYKAIDIKGLKFWKTFGLELRDKNNVFLDPTQSRFDCIWKYASEFGLPVMIHVADPVAFFNPIDSKNERYEELSSNPEWSFYSNGFKTFEELINMQEQLLVNNKKTTFILPHLGSYSENLTFVAKMLDEHDNLLIDITERINELGRQPYTARKFLTKYSEKILFGTDYFPTKDVLYSTYYRFLETDDEYFKYDMNEIPSQGRWNIYGVYLDDVALENIYNKNAKRLLGICSK